MTAHHILKFGPFCFLPRRRLLLTGGTEIKIGNRAIDILAALLANPGELVGKQDLMARVWPNSIVEEINLRVHVAALRRALGDGQRGCRYITNAVGRGYRFVAPVTKEDSLPASQPPRSSPNHPLAPPAPLTTLLGRDKSLESLIERVSANRMITVVGSAGVGKSALAQVAAHRLAPQFRDGAVCADLATQSDSTQLASTVASTVARVLCADPRSPDLKRLLQHRHVLLVLDHCEHLLGEAALLCEELLHTLPHLRILATSREALGVEAERRHHLPSLSVPTPQSDSSAEKESDHPSVRLFVERARACLPRFELNDANAGYVGQICRRLDGVPLAIDLVASRVTLLSVRELASRPDAWLLDVTNRRRTAPLRHHTVRSALDWSATRLAATEHVLLQRLSVFPGPFTVESALSMASGVGLERDEITDGIMSLTEKSLLDVHKSGSMTQHYMPQLLRTYAVEKMSMAAGAA